MEHKEGHMLVRPDSIGWKRQGATRAWTKPDGSTHTFPAGGPMLVHHPKPTREHLAEIGRVHAEAAARAGVPIPEEPKEE